jgi:hypothetical protein
MKTTSLLQRHRADIAVLGFVLLVALAIILAIRGDGLFASLVVLAGVVYLANYASVSGRVRSNAYFALFIWGDVEPSLEGPFRTPEERDAKSLEIRRREGPDEGGIYMLDIDEWGNPSVAPYCGGFLDDVDDEQKTEGPNAPGDTTQFVNHYSCQCGHVWADVWPALCDDTCARCGTRDISPYKSEEVRP